MSDWEKREKSIKGTKKQHSCSRRKPGEHGILKAKSLRCFKKATVIKWC